MRKEVNRSDRVGIFDRQLKVHKCSMRGTGSEEWKNGRTKSNKKKRQLPHPCTTQPARMGHPQKETRGKIKSVAHPPTALADVWPLLLRFGFRPRTKSRPRHPPSQEK